MTRVERMSAGRRRRAPSQLERFVAAPAPRRAPTATPRRRRCASALAARSVAAGGPATLLEQLERAGERPRTAAAWASATPAAAASAAAPCENLRHRRGLERARRGDPALHLASPRSDLELDL